MRVKLLGSAAGGGVPQWNCRCANCRKARQGLIVERTQSCVAFSADGNAWFLINASPDIRQQLALLPSHNAQTARDNVFEAVILSNADLDHALGLLVAREGGPVTTYCSEDVWRSLAGENGFERTLKTYFGGEGIDARILGPEPVELRTASGEATGMELRTILLGGTSPRYDPGVIGGNGHACAFTVKDQHTGAKFVCAIDLPGPNEELQREMAGADLVILDGTFWSDREMVDLGFSNRTATDMGHWPISGQNGSLAMLKSLSREPGRTVYSHINNTNPMLDPASPEKVEVEAACVVIGEDGLEWTI